MAERRQLVVSGLCCFLMLNLDEVNSTWYFRLPLLLIFAMTLFALGLATQRIWLDR